MVLLYEYVHVSSTGYHSQQWMHLIWLVVELFFHKMYFKRIIKKYDHISWIFLTFQSKWWVIKQRSSQFLYVFYGGPMTTLTMTCQTKNFIGPSGWWVLKLVRLRQTVRVGACSTTGIKFIIENNCFTDSTCNVFCEYKSQTSLDYPELNWLSYRLGLHVTSTCVYKTQSWHQVPESGDTFLQSAFLRPFTIVW